MAGKQITVSVLADTKKFSGAMKKLGNETGLTRLAGGAKKLGKAMLITGAAVAAATVVIGKKLLDAGETASTSNARIEQIATSMGLFGDQTGKVSARLVDLANKTAVATGVDQNQIKATQSKLLTFKELAKSADTVGGQFDRATKAAIDLGAAGFGTAEMNAVQLGKAMNDPVKGIAALNKSGIQFTDIEKEKIATLVDSNQVSEAQIMILDAIEKQVGGTAEATADATDQMKVKWSQLQENLGMKLMPMLQKVSDVFIDKIVPAVEDAANALGAKLGPMVQKVKDWFADNREEIEQVVTAIKDGLVAAYETLVEAGGKVVQFLQDAAVWVQENKDWILTLAAAITGAVVGYNAYIKVMAIWKAATAVATAAQAAFNAILSANPIGLIVLAIAALVAGLVYFFTQTELGQEIWEKVWTAIQTGFQAFMDWLDPILVQLGEAWEIVWARIQEAWEVVGPPLIAAIQVAIEVMKTHIQTILNVLKTIFQTVWNQIKIVIETAMGIIQGVIKTVTSLIKGDWKGVWDGIKQIFGSIVNGIVSTAKNLFNGLKNAVSAIFNGMKSALSTIVNGIKTAISNGFRNAKDSAVNMFKSMKTGVVNAGKSMINWVKDIPNKIKRVFTNGPSMLLNAGKQIIDGFLGGIQSKFNSVKAKLGELTSFLPSWKGPAKRDKNILAKSGQLVIGGFQKGLEDSYGSVKKSLGRFTGSLSDTNIPVMAPALSRPALNLANRGSNRFDQPTINITVNAGVGDPYAIAREIKNTLSKYETANGRRR